jgi:hypothetical protein
MAFDLEAARKAGYTDAEIAEHLAGVAAFDIKRARSAGYSDGEIIAGLVQKTRGLAPSAAIPGQENEPARAAAARAQPGPSIGQRVVGAGEAALATVTGATTGAAGMIGGTVKGMAQAVLDGSFGTPEAARMVEQSAAQGAQALTFAPRTETGQEYAQALGDVAQQLVPLAGLTPQVGALGQAAAQSRTAAPLARAGAQQAAQAVAAATPAPVAAAAQRVAALGREVTSIPRRAREALQRTEQAPTPGTMGSAGAAGTDMAAQRVAAAEQLGFTGDAALTRGQATRDPAQLKFEVEAAKMPDEGAPLRERAVAQNQQLLNTVDSWIDQTGGQATTLRQVGVAVDKALRDQMAKDKADVRAAYKAAEHAGELEAPVTMDALISHLNDAAPESVTAPLISTARSVAIKLGIAADQDGILVAQPVPLKTAERFRQAVSRNTDFEPTNVRQATIIKGLVDEQTANLGGGLYKQARAKRARMAQNYEDIGVIDRLVTSRRGSTDRRVALEDVFENSILRASLDDVRQVRRVLQRSGEPGQQAWKELQSATARYLQDEMTKNVATDSAGRRVVSAAALDKAVRALDADGRLDFVFGKQGAQQLRDLRDLAQYVKTVPPEAAINTSNTAATLMGVFADTGVSGMAGAPLPLVTMVRGVRQYVQDRALRRRIEEALRNADRKNRTRARSAPPVSMPAPQPQQMQ